MEPATSTTPSTRPGRLSPALDRPTLPATAIDLEILRKYEPVIVYTGGEVFFPVDVEGYVRECSLWTHDPDGRDKLLIPQGKLTLEELINEPPAAFGTVRYLRFVETLTLAETAQVLAAQAALRRNEQYHFRAGVGRLARGGLLPRLADALFSLSFLLRGKVSAATAAAAEIDYSQMRRANPRYTYYGRVTRQGGWTVAQYWYLYCYNNWRSGFYGVNDHESDWEMISVYLYEDDGVLSPEWVAYASHDFHGDDLRRRWDDRGELALVEGHPVVYAGAGSHAAYFVQGEYQAEVTLPLPSWLNALVNSWRKFWTEVLGQPASNPFRIPFVDYARGDGVSIGPGQPLEWSPVLIDESTPWVRSYRGLWGLFARDPISGENAPAGPLHNRDGTPRGTWYDPLGFAGLDRVPPPSLALRLLRENMDQLESRQTELERLIHEKTEKLQALGTKQRSMQGNPHLAKQYVLLEKIVAELAAEVRGLRRERNENSALLEGLAEHLDRLRAGIQDEPHAHIRHLAVPAKTKAVRFERAAETWAAVSLSLLFIAVGLLILLTPQYIFSGLIVVLVLFVLVESILRGAFVETVARITVLLALVGTLILFVTFWKYILVIGLVGTGLFIFFQRLRELYG
jgi:hypothetical protein